MPHAHAFHSHGLRGAWHLQQVQRAGGCHCWQNHSLLLGGHFDLGSAWDV